MININWAGIFDKNSVRGQLVKLARMNPHLRYALNKVIKNLEEPPSDEPPNGGSPKAD